MNSESLNRIVPIVAGLVVLTAFQLAGSAGPLNAAAATASAATATPPPEAQYTVAFVLEGDTLNVRADAGVQFAVLDTLKNGDSVQVIGAGKKVDQDVWLPIRYGDGKTGWVNHYFLAESLEPAAFCDDARLKPLIAVLQYAVRRRDGQALARLVGPHGLYVALSEHKSLHLPIDQVQGIFEDKTIRPWGDTFSGRPISDSLAGGVTRLLQRDLLPKNVIITCNDNQDTLSFQDELYALNIPGYKTTNFYAVMRPGRPGYEFDWGAWGLSIDYWDGQPVLLGLGHYVWTP